MKTTKKIIFSIIAVSCVIPLYYLVTQKPIHLISLSNGYFMVGLLFLVIGFGILVLSSGFFDFFQKNMKNLLFLRKKNEPKEYIPLSQVFQKKPIYWLVIGAFFIGVSFLFSVL